MDPHNYHIFKITVRFVTGVGLVFGGFELVLGVCASFCGGGGFEAYWVFAGS